MVNGYISLPEYSTEIIGDFVVTGDVPGLTYNDRKLQKEILDTCAYGKPISFKYSKTVDNGVNSVSIVSCAYVSAAYLTSGEIEIAYINVTNGRNMFVITTTTEGGSDAVVIERHTV